MQLQTYGTYIAMVHAICQHWLALRFQLTHDVLAKRIISIDHRHAQLRPSEQQLLGCCVVFHGFVIVQMVAAQVGQHGHIEFHAIDTPLVQAMG